MPTESIHSLSQADVAQYLKVDRTTIRSWGIAGMPFEPPTGKGLEGRYDLSVAIYWQVWTSVKGKLQAPRCSPLHALALAYFYFTAVVEPHIRDARAEGLKMFPGMVAKYFPRKEIELAMSWALGFLDARFGATKA